jgi:hypothetical protein
MRLPRFSISALVFAVALIAVDFTLVHYLFIHSHRAMVSVRYGLLMVNVLAIAVFLLWRGRGTRQPFLSGLVAVGMVTALICQACCWILAPEGMYQWQARLAFPVASNINDILPRRPSTNNGYDYHRILFYAATIPPIAIVVGLPQLIVALVGGVIGVGVNACVLKKHLRAWRIVNS